LKTERLYYDDPWCLAFDGTVRGIRPTAGGAAVELDRTAFHPTGGGQPHDTGSLADARVVDVVAEEDGRVLHVLGDGPVPEIGVTVTGRVDADRRRDHLQQHSGQHLLSAAFVRARDAATRSFHMGARTCTLDLDRPPEALGDLQAVEDLANRVIAEDRPMSARIVDEAEALALPLRKEIPVRGRVRVVAIDGFDLTPCGGTHARHTREIGAVAILGSERHRRGTRIEFVAGDRVRAALHRAVEEAAALGARLSAPAGERVGALERLLEERRGDRRRLRDLSRRSGRLEAAERAARGAGPVVCEVVEDRTPEEIDAMARALADSGRLAVLGWIEGEAARVVVAGPGTPDAGALLREVGARFGARGGGGPRFAQAGGIDPTSLPELLKALEAARGS
jgi:alanyl-tRNA synthetase